MQHLTASLYIVELMMLRSLYSHAPPVVPSAGEQRNRISGVVYLFIIVYYLCIYLLPSVKIFLLRLYANTV